MRAERCTVFRFRKPIAVINFTHNHNIIIGHTQSSHLKTIINFNFFPNFTYLGSLIKHSTDIKRYNKIINKTLLLSIFIYFKSTGKKYSPE